jgi:hypothetical protein
MRKYAESTIFSDATGPDGKAIVVEVRSMTNPKKLYRVDLTNGRCSCPSWIFQRGGGRKPCKHLRALGYAPLQFPVQEVEVKEPPKPKKSKRVAFAVTEDML